MANFARVINNIAVDVSTDPTNHFHPTIAAEFIPVPDEVQHGWVRTDGEWAAPAPTPQPEPEPTYPKVTPVEFKMLFASAERIAIKAARETDPVIDDYFDIVEDPRLQVVDLGLHSVQEGIHYLQTIGILTEDRVSQILAGTIL
jgi:hypothetical protein